MAANKENGVESLEHGHIYFFYRPRVQEHEPQGREDVQRSYVVLSPQGKKTYRLMILGRKRLPDPSKSGRSRFWAFVDEVASDPKQIERDLQEHSYSTKTRGERHVPAARPAGEGVYRVLRHDDHTHLVYALELPRRPDEVQQELGIEEEASYIVSVKNPQAPAPRTAGLSEEKEASYPKRLQEQFRGRKFGELDPPDFLDYQGTELLLISASDDVEGELGLKLHPSRENEASADIFRDLRLEKSKHPIEPLLKGEWE